jgi:hypothetical protein
MSVPLAKHRNNGRLPSLWRKPDSNFWSLNQSSSAVLTPDAMAGHIRHGSFRRAPHLERRATVPSRQGSHILRAKASQLQA